MNRRHGSIAGRPSMGDRGNTEAQEKRTSRRSLSLRSSLSQGYRNAPLCYSGRFLTTRLPERNRIRGPPDCSIAMTGWLDIWLARLLISDVVI
jgi:hypothetical protein